MAVSIFVLKKTTDETAQVPEPGGSEKSNETFPLSSTSTYLSSILMHLVTEELSLSLDDHLTFSQYHLLHFQNDPEFKNLVVPVLNI